MRISDWSSYVCSSDLAIAQDKFTIERAATALNDLLSDPAELAGMASAARSVGRPLAAQALAELVARVVAGRRNTIGRASRRARVWPYELTSCDPVSINKNKQL